MYSFSPSTVSHTLTHICVGVCDIIIPYLSGLVLSTFFLSPVLSYFLKRPTRGLGFSKPLVGDICKTPSSPSCSYNNKNNIRVSQSDNIIILVQFCLYNFSNTSRRINIMSSRIFLPFYLKRKKYLLPILCITRIIRSNQVDTDDQMTR